MDNRRGLVVSTRYTQATGTAECEAAVEMVRGLRCKSRSRQMTLGADKAYDRGEFIDTVRKLRITPHIAQKESRGSGVLDRRTTRHVGYEISQRKRKVVEEIFGWGNTIGLLRKIRFKGVARGGWMFTFTAAVYNLIRMRTLAGASP